MQDVLYAYSEQKIAEADFVTHYHIGDAFSGETDFRLHGDGAYELWSTATSGRRHMSYAGQIDSSRVRQVVAAMIEAKIWEVRHVRTKPGEDDPTATIAVESGGERYEVVLWVSEIKQVPTFAAVQNRLLGLIRELSNGEVLESGQ